MEWIVAEKLKGNPWLLYKADPTLEVLQPNDPKRVNLGLKVSNEE